LKDAVSSLESLQSALFKKETEIRKLNSHVKDLQEINTLNAQNRNNTSSSFTLPSEFKAEWDKLVKESMIDAFPDFLESYKHFTMLSQEIFIVVIEQVRKAIAEKYETLARSMNLNGEEQIKHVTVKLKPIFQDYCNEIFSLSDEQYEKMIEEDFLPRCEKILADSEEDDAMDLLKEGIEEPEFKSFVNLLHKIALHLELSEPSI